MNKIKLNYLCGVDAEDAKTIMEWAKEYGVPFHGPERHLNRPQLSSQNWHFHIGNSSKIGHIPIVGDIIGTFGVSWQNVLLVNNSIRDCKKFCVK